MKEDIIDQKESCGQNGFLIDLSITCHGGKYMYKYYHLTLFTDRLVL